MKRMLAFTRKEFRHILRDWRTLIILIGMPVIQVTLFGFAITNEIRDAYMVILDKSKDVHSLAISQKILSTEYFKLAQRVEGDADLHRIFKQGRVKFALVFEPGFGENLLREGGARYQVIADATDPNTANLLINYVRAITTGYEQELNRGMPRPVQIGFRQKMLYNPELKGVYLFVPGTISIILMLVSAMMTSISITREKELGTMEVLLATPMSPVQIIVAKVLPYILLAFINASMVLFLGVQVFGVPIHGSLALLGAETLLFVITVLSLGIFISTLTSSQQVALMVSLMGLMLPTILLSGFIFPVENMPKLLQFISNIVPARWFIIILRSIMLKGAGLELLWKETAILFGFAAFFILLSVKNFKVRLT
jgi:ABC-2 type transport system permease protein